MKNIGGNIKIAIGLTALLWIIFLVDAVIPMDLRSWGLRPRNMDGLWGILYSPFLHGNLGHILANSGAFCVLTAVSLSFSRKLAIRALFIIWLLGGLLVWAFAAGNTVHVGASGIIFGLIGFLLCVGIFRKEPMALLFSILVFFLYGGSLFSLFVVQPGVSWSGHFFGFLSGVFAAWTSKNSKSA